MISPSKGGGSQNHKHIEPTHQCNCLCVCFGLFDYDDWKFDYS